MSQTLFLIISVLGILAAVGTILARNLVHAALYLVAFFFIIACQFVLLEAEFLAAIQVLVYIGAVAIILMFGIMLTRNIQGDDTTTIASGGTLPALVAGLGLFLVISLGIHHASRPRVEDTLKKEQSDLSVWSATPRRVPLAVKEGEALSSRALVVNNMGKFVGEEMMTRFVVPFEVAGLLLTAALVGAIALAHRERDDEPPSRLGARAAAADGSAGPSGNGQTQHDGAKTEALKPSPK